MHGNVSEWCWDWDPVFHNCGSESDDFEKLTKGGSWKSWADCIRSSENSFCYAPNKKDDTIGFRIVRDFLE